LRVLPAGQVVLPLLHAQVGETKQQAFSVVTKELCRFFTCSFNKTSREIKTTNHQNAGKQVHQPLSFAHRIFGNSEFFNQFFVQPHIVVATDLNGFFKLKEMSGWNLFLYQ